MKKKLRSFLILMALLAGFQASAESLVITGIYQGKDLYVKNPFSEDGVGFCIFEVYVNGELTRDEINSSAFAIDFNILGIETGSDIEVIIKHKDGCNPLVLNPEAVKPHSTFEVESIDIKNNVLTWSTTNESGSLPFVVEQFRWNKWVKVGEVQGKGTSETHEYQFELTPYSGENKVRVKQVDYTAEPRYSKQVTYTSNVKKVTFSPQKKVEDKVVFSNPTRFEIFDQYGNLVKTGYGSEVDVANCCRSSSANSKRISFSTRARQCITTSSSNSADL
ncbi:MAG: hypothetical protein LC664_13695 [Flavobacteriales bacterium]|nr:hypothetical protein [Flavobacteriales bacterium]